ncbi:Pentatricopeptide repeat-containing protein [Dichanthelium oligosanthes]|uniref:Pentatricopeptide repeat-containing protein n=1 Tax=Dichanthelium oligosanthes TaxID=888268 RepID=A0A1E5VDN2_9POAL|nr:Pentatricopeptide repeat-containing protein [Dichanthelium oligosanthes]
MAMASPAAYSRARRLFSICSSTVPRAEAPKPVPAPTQDAAAGEAEAKPNAGRSRRKPLGKILRVISEERDPDKLVSQFIAASTASPRFRDNHRVYEVAVSRLTSFGRHDAVAVLLDSQKAFLEASNEDFAARIVRLYGRASMPSHAATTFLGLPAKHKSVTAFNALLAAYVDGGDFDALATALQEIPASGPTEKPDPSAALGAIVLMEKCGLTPDMISFNTLLNGFYNNGRFDEAEKVWEMMKERNLQPNAKTYNAKLRGLVAGGRIEDAVSVIERMQKDGPKPDSVSYNELIRGFCKGGRLDEAKKAYDDLGPNRLCSKTLAARLALSQSSRRKPHQHRRRVAPPFAMASPAAASRARRLSSIVSKTTPSAQPPASAPAPAPKAAAGEAEAEPKAARNLDKSISKIATAIFRERDPDKLVSQFVAASASQRFRDKHRVYEVAVSRLASFDRQDAIAAILDSQKPFLEASNEGFATRLVRLYGRASMPSQAAATFLDLPAKHKSVMTFNALLAAYVDAGDFDALATAFQQIPASHPTIVPNVYSYNILISALCQKQDFSAALDVIPLMEKCGLTADHISFNTLLNGFYNSGRFDDVEKVWEMMKDRNIEPDTKSYNAKLRGLVSKGSIEDAIALIERMQKDGPKPDTVSYNELIRGYCKEGRLDEAKKVYDDLVKNECAPNRGTFHTLVPRFVEVGELDRALSCCHEVFSRKCKVQCSMLQGVVTALVDASRVEEAKRIVELGRMNYYPRKGLRMPPRTGVDKGLKMQPPTGEDNDVEAETDLDDSALYEAGCEEEEESKNA